MIRRRQDFSTMIGILTALGLIAAAIGIGGNARAFVDVPSILIVFCGTAAVVVAGFSFQEVLYSSVLVCKILLLHAEDCAKAALFAMQVAERARKEGILGLETDTILRSHNAFFHKGIGLLADATPLPHITNILTLDISSMMERYVKAVAVLRKGGEVAPAMGLIGTLIGLVQMLGDISDTSKIGPAMAIALLTTFYGAMLAYVILFPLASKLERHAKDEMLATDIYFRAITSIAQQENPRQLETLLNSMLPPAKKIHYFKN